MFASLSSTSTVMSDDPIRPQMLLLFSVLVTPLNQKPIAV
jgi:hypothetical protein